MKNGFIRSALIVPLALVLVGSAGATNAAPVRRPNVLVILADDLGFSDLGCYGSEIRTPNLDRLAADGMRFTQAYNNAVCIHSRASLLTGVSPRQGPAGLLRPNMLTLGEAMRAAGYQTSLIGKWHLGSVAPLRPVDRGFDYFYGLLDGASNYFNPADPDPAFLDGKHRQFADNAGPVTEFPAGYYTTDAFSDRAIERIRHATGSGQPFFINLCYTAPHYPLQAPAEDIARYRGKYHGGYEQLRRERFQRQVDRGLVDPAVTGLSSPDHKTGSFRYDYEVTPWEQLTAGERRREEERMEVYAAMVDRLDQGVGRVLAALAETGQAEDTVVVFLSDNGGCASLPDAAQLQDYIAFNRDIPVGDRRGYEFVGPGWGWAQNSPFRRHKTWTYEGGISTPMIVRWPRVVRAGAVNAEQWHLVDFMPTLLELAGQVYPASGGGPALLPLEGRSLLPALLGRAAGARPVPLCWELFGNRAVRDGRWKLVWGASDRRWELYDLSVDRSETHDLAARHPDRVAALATIWSQWAQRTEVPDQ
jgi:arylsulfatase